MALTRAGVVVFLLVVLMAVLAVVLGVIVVAVMVGTNPRQESVRISHPQDAAHCCTKLRCTCARMYP